MAGSSRTISKAGAKLSFRDFFIIGAMAAVLSQAFRKKRRVKLATIKTPITQKRTVKPKTQKR